MTYFPRNTDVKAPGIIGRRLLPGKVGFFPKGRNTRAFFELHAQKRCHTCCLSWLHDGCETFGRLYKRGLSQDAGDLEWFGHCAGAFGLTVDYFPIQIGA